MLSLILFLSLLTGNLGIDNGLGVTPPMGWRSWNCFHGNVYTARIEGQVDALVTRNRTIWNGKTMSLFDLGYIDIGLDDNWQACHTGVNGSFHNAQGVPLINTQRFPSMGDMVAYGHKKGVRMGWYHNNCICKETYGDLKIYEGDVNAIAGYKFDGVKLDGCGPERNLTLWAQLLNATGRPVLIENCHWGQTIPTLTWCPFNFFRSSGDISPNWDRILSNLATTIKFQDPVHPLARPGCWAYPDMLEVGNSPLTYLESRSHFGAWCVVSSPLTLGFDMTDQTILTSIWDIISNTEAIAVNQAWEGHPGYRAKVYYVNSTSLPLSTVALKCDNSEGELGWALKSDQTITQNGNCLDSSDEHQIQLVKCTGAATQKWVHRSTKQLYNVAKNKCIDVYDYHGPVVQMYDCKNAGSSMTNQQFTFEKTEIKASSGECLSTQSTSELQLWAKPVGKNGELAVLLINDSEQMRTFDVPLADLNITASVSIRDIWNHKDMGTFSGKFPTKLGVHDSFFGVLTPK